MSQFEKYKEEYEKYKNVKLEIGIPYTLNAGDIRKEVLILEINEEKQTANIVVGVESRIRTKTLHWCRKYLKKT